MSDPDDRDMLAAEYVLGTLDAEERIESAARLGTDANFARAVEAWEDRLSPLIESLVEVAPAANVYAALATQLFGASQPRSVRSTDDLAALRRHLRRWQSATVGFALLAASLIAWVAVRDVAPTSGSQQFTAVLQKNAGAPTMVVDVDLATRRLTVRPLAAAAPAGQTYELWIIDSALGSPRSLGVLPAHADVERSLRSYSPAVIAEATYAVTVEPPGGSPTGRPSAAPVLTGKLSNS